MLGSKENIDEDVIDFKSLLLNAGITKSAHRDALLEIYHRMSEEIVAVDRFSAVDLLHTAFLVRQRSLRGFPAEQSIRNACIDVYVKPRPSRDLRFREHLTFLIDETIERHVAHDEEMPVIDLDAATWSVRNLQDNTRLVIIRQQGLLLNAAIKMYKSFLKSDDSRNIGRDIVTTKLLNDFCGLKEDEKLNVDVADVLPYLLLNFYEQSSRVDVSLRKVWISKMLRGNAILDDLEEKSVLMASVIALFNFKSANMRNSLPWDLWQLVGKMTCDEDDGACRDVNKLLLLLYAYGMVLKNNTSQKKTEMSEIKNEISVMLYSSAVNDGKYSKLLTNLIISTISHLDLQRV